MKRFLFLFVTVLLLSIKIGCVLGSINFSGLDTKNVRNNYRELLKNGNKKDINDVLFLEEYAKSNYTSVNVIAASTSRYFYNYRHTTNLLTAYNYVKECGDVMEKNLVLMVPFDQACDCRNIKAGTIFTKYKNSITESIDEIEEKKLNQYRNVHADYKNDNVRELHLRAVMRHRYSGFMPKRSRLPIYEEKKKNLFLYLTGHGGSNYLKIQEYNIISSSEFSLYIQELLIKNYYKFIFVIIDTCQGYSFYDVLLHYIKRKGIKNVFLLSSSDRVQNSISLFSSGYLSVSTIDRFTYNFFQYLENIYKVHNPNEAHKNVKHFSMSYMLNYLSTRAILSTPTINNPRFNLTMFLHDKNIIFYNSNPLLIEKEIYDFEYNASDIQKKDDRIEFRKICLSNLFKCDHLKKSIHENATTFYEHRNYYYNYKNYVKTPSYFTDYVFTSTCSNDDIKKWCILLASAAATLFLSFLLLNACRF